jgi:P-type Ca2+ transporter type 2C
MGAMRLARRRALVRQLSSVETLGSVTVICSDKTGTLTRNEMTVREIFTPDGNYTVSGSGYSPQGRITGTDGASVSLSSPAASARGETTEGWPWLASNVRPDVRRVLIIGCWCNHADVVPDPEGGDTWHAIGDPTEAALVVAARKVGLGRETKTFHVEYEIPFDSERKAMSVVLVDAARMRVVMTKGAPEVVLSKCRDVLHHGVIRPLSAEDRAEISRANIAMASRALRVLGLAYRENVDPQEGERVEHDLVFAGLVGMLDPPRDEARHAIADCHLAGIRPVMITGDQPATALAIGAELRLAKDSSGVVTGRELDEMNDDELARRLPTTGVFARVSAEHKLRVVRALRDQSEIVAMTGDGVNDAPAVKNADIGIAMGSTGTDVTKQAASLVLLDDNFATIVRAVEEGRAIFDNILKFVHYLLAGNAGKLLFMLAAILLGWPAPLLPLQILWLNLVTDGLPALALGAEPTARGLMARRPRGVHEPLIDYRRATRILMHGGLTSLAALVGFAVIYRSDPASLSEAQLVAFCILGLGQLAYAFVCRSETQPLSRIGWATNRPLLAAVTVSFLLQVSVVLVPALHHPFGIEAYPDAMECAWIIVLSLLPAIVVELGKRFAAGRHECEVGHDLLSHDGQAEPAPSHGQNIET